MNQQKRREIFGILAEARPDASKRVELQHTLRTACCRHAIRASHGQECQHRHLDLVSRCQYTGKNCCTRRSGTRALYSNDRTVSLQGQTRCCSLPNSSLEKHDGRVPDDFNALTALPGVGAKTANVVLNVAFGHPTIAVDTHIFRVSNRTGIAPGKTPDAVSEKLLKTTPKEYLLNAHHWLLLHGRYCCKAKNPDCQHCPIENLCEFKDKNL